MAKEGIRTLDAPTLKDFKMYLSLDRDCRPHTILQHECNLQLIFRFLQSKKLSYNPLAIREFLSHYKESRDAGTIHGYIFTIRVLCEYLVKHNIISNNWGKEIKLPRRMRKLPEILSVEEIEAIFNAPVKYKKPEHRQLWDTLFQFLARTGCRIGEALGSSVSTLDLKKGTWKILESKTRQQRLIPLDPEMVKMLEKLIIGKQPDDPIFSSQRIDIKGGFLHQTSVRGELKRRVIATGITKHVSPHTFRHSFITELMRQDISILKIAMLCGHEEIETTQRYAKLVMEDLRSSIVKHPIIAKTRNPYEIIEHIKEVIKSFHLETDKRFHYELSEGNEGIRLSLFIR
jgi:site-specific recombinase XerD